MIVSRSPSFPAAFERPGRVSGMILLRLALALAVTFVLIATTFAADRTVLKGDVVVGADVLTLGDLVEGVSAEAAGTALFRAPALGQTGTIQDLYRYHGIDTQSIVAAAQAIAPGRPMRHLRIVAE